MAKMVIIWLCSVSETLQSKKIDFIFLLSQGTILIKILFCVIVSFFDEYVPGASTEVCSCFPDTLYQVCSSHQNDLHIMISDDFKKKDISSYREDIHNSRRTLGHSDAISTCVISPLTEN